MEQSQDLCVLCLMTAFSELCCLSPALCACVGASVLRGLLCACVCLHGECVCLHALLS